MKTEIQEKIKNYLCKSFGITSSKLEMHTNLLDHWIMDSIHVLTIAQFLESEFAIELTADDMDMNNFTNLHQLSHFVFQKMSL